MQLNDRNTYILNEILVRYEKLYNRYISIKDYYKDISLNLLNDQKIKELILDINSNVDFDKVIKSKDLIFNLDLDKMGKLLLNNPELLNIKSNELVKQIDLNIENYKWLIKCILVNIDTLINIFFKLLFDVDREDSLPRGLYDNPSIHIYKVFPKLNGILDDELKDLVKLHTLRNNIVHNDLIVDNKLKNKLQLDGEVSDNTIQLFLPDFESVTNHITICLYIIYNCCYSIKTPIDILEKSEDRNIARLLSDYCKKKNNIFYK